MAEQGPYKAEVLGSNPSAPNEWAVSSMARAHT